MPLDATPVSAVTLAPGVATPPAGPGRGGAGLQPGQWAPAGPAAARLPSAGAVASFVLALALLGGLLAAIRVVGALAAAG